jgi:hypothetical protein
VAEECRRLEGQVTIHACTGTGDLVEASWAASSSPASGGAQKGILLLSHMDTVFPLGTLGKMPFFEKD